MQEAKLNLGKVVRIARKRKRITQDYLAEKVGVQPRTILEIENGRGNPRFENLFVMVRLLDIAPNDIFNYDCGLAQDTEQLFQELSSFSEDEQRMAAAAARAVLQQIRYPPLFLDKRGQGTRSVPCLPFGRLTPLPSILFRVPPPAVPSAYGQGESAAHNMPAGAVRRLASEHRDRSFHRAQCGRVPLRGFCFPLSLHT